MTSNLCNKQQALAFLVVVAAGVTPRCAVSLPSQDGPPPALDCNAFTGERQGAVEISPVPNPSSAPSDAPSQAPLCADPLSNARGVYTSIHAPCSIKFHSVSNLQRQGEEGEPNFIEYRTSNLCRDDTVIVEIKEYLEFFPDECVGDFERCYSLEHHSKYLYPFLCLPEELPSQEYLVNGISYHSRWELPPGTTHVSVDCTLDKDVGHDVTNARVKEERKHARQERLEEIEMKLINWVLVCVSSLSVIYALSHFIVTPLVSMAKSRNERRRRRRSSRSCHSRRGRTLRTSSTLSSSLSSLPLHHEEHVTLVAEGVVEGQVLPVPQDDESSRSDDDSQDCSRSSSSDDSFSRDREQQRMHDFDSQVPCDFDAVPIVAATILSVDDAIPATVIQDGISYS